MTYTDIHDRLIQVKKRTTVWLPERLLAKLKKVSAKTGAPMAELFRRAVEAYLRKL
jgi:predicted DNA-binding protein